MSDDYALHADAIKRLVAERDALIEALERAKAQIRSEHAYKASIGGSPCVCEYCAPREALEA